MHSSQTVTLGGLRIVIQEPLDIASNLNTVKRERKKVILKEKKKKKLRVP